MIYILQFSTQKLYNFVLAFFFKLFHCNNRLYKMSRNTLLYIFTTVKYHTYSIQTLKKYRICLSYIVQRSTIWKSSKSYTSFHPPIFNDPHGNFENTLLQYLLLCHDFLEINGFEDLLLHFYATCLYIIEESYTWLQWILFEKSRTKKKTIVY